jgi:hypothetical protein
VYGVLAVSLIRPLRSADDGADVPVVAMSLLHRLPVFAPLPTLALEAVARSAIELPVAAGEVVIHQGDSGDRFYAVADGAFDVVMSAVLMRTVRRGEGFGEVALLADVPRTATVTATQPGHLLAIERGPFLIAVTGHDSSRQAAWGVVRSMTFDSELPDAPGRTDRHATQLSLSGSSRRRSHIAPPLRQSVSHGADGRLSRHVRSHRPAPSQTPARTRARCTGRRARTGATGLHRAAHRSDGPGHPRWSHRARRSRHRSGRRAHAVHERVARCPHRPVAAVDRHRRQLGRVRRGPAPRAVRRPGRHEPDDHHRRRSKCADGRAPPASSTSM